MTAADVKQMIEGYVSQIKSMKETKVSEIFDSLAPMTYANVLSMVDGYSAPLTLNVTVDANGKVISYKVAYEVENYVTVSVEQKADGNIPVVTVSYDGQGLTLKETENGAILTVNVMGVVGTLELTEKADGFTLDLLVQEAAGETTETTTETTNKAEPEVTSEPTTVAEETTTEETATTETEEKPAVYAKIAITFKKTTDFANNVIGGMISFEGQFDSSIMSGSIYESGTSDTIYEYFDTDEEEDDSTYYFKGTVVVAKADKELDQTVVTQLTEKQKMFYQCNISFVYYGDYMRLYYVKDATGEYYILSKTEYDTTYLSPFISNGVTYYRGQLATIEYSARIASIDGYPDTYIFGDEDCADWIYAYFAYTGNATITYTEQSGLFTKTNGIYEAANTTVTKTESESSVASFYGYSYYNTKTGAYSTSSQHTYTYTSKFLNTSTKNCYDGIIYTATCSVCGDTYTQTTYTHTYEDTVLTTFKTQCDEESYVYVARCVACGYSYVSDSMYRNHRYNNSYGHNITAEELASYGFDTTGFTDGDVNVKRCTVCGLTIYDVTWYTTTSNGCYEHFGCYVVYEGNKDYAAFTISKEGATVESHHSSNGTEGSASLSELISKVEKYYGGSLPFTPNYVQEYRKNVCKCGKVVYEYLTLLAVEDLDNPNDSYAQIELHIEYNNDGTTVHDWYIWGEDYNLTDVEKAAGKYAIDDPITGYVRYSVTSRATETTVFTQNDDDENVTVTVCDYTDAGLSDTMTISYFYASRCLSIRESYVKVNGEWKIASRVTSKNHSQTTYSLTEGGEDCDEDGVTVVCGKCREAVYSDEEKLYDHDYTWDGGYGSLADYASYLTKGKSGSVSGLSATVEHGGICNTCHTMLDVTITLTANWTLTSDVYLKAEYITINFNGYTIDLNGHTLTVYGYDGSDVTFTDSTYNTAEGTENHYSVVDNSTDKTGIFIVGTNGGDIDVGTIAINAKYDFTDHADRQTLISDARESIAKQASSEA
jgi:hypothetical protein